MSEHNDIQVAVLGPLRIRGTESIAAPMERTLLALLVTKSGQLATDDWLIEHLWRERAPRQATNSLQTYVSHLRPMLEPDHQPGQPWRALRREPGGYLLDVTRLDCRTFIALVNEANALVDTGDLTAAETALTSALDLWQGDEAFIDVSDAAPIRHMIDDVNAHRLQALKTLARIRIDTARPTSVLTELAALRSQNPADEELVALTMLALQGAGRTAEALLLYDEVARRLREELGAYPGSTLRQAHTQLLRVDEPVAVATFETVAAPRRQPDHRRNLAVAGLIVAAVLSLVVGRELLRSSDSADLELRGARPDQVSTDEIYNQLDLIMQPGIAHDLDVPPGRDTTLPTGLPPGSAEFKRGDLYRQKEHQDRLSGWASGQDNTGFNTFERVGSATDVLQCRERPDAGGGNMQIVTARVGDKACLRTHEGRWALLTLTSLPDGPQMALTVRIVVLRLDHG